MPDLSSYAPVVKFALEDVGPGLSGYAAPAPGAPPCLIGLMARARPIMFVAATRHASTAASAGFRGGWCGFHVPGLAHAFAVADEVQLICGVTRGPLAAISFDETLFEAPPASSEVLTAADILALSRSDVLAPDLAAILPFAVAHLNRFGQRAFVEATYQTLLKRWPENDLALDLSDGIPSEAVAEKLLRDIATSSEYAAGYSGGLPGPFHPNFRYTTDGLI